MTKKQFLKKLESELSILDEMEIKDIINEYNDIIEEKVKHGKKETEAVEEVGSVEDLASDILSAYKVNPNYKKKSDDGFSDSAKKLGEDFDALVKKGAKKATKFTQDVMDTMKANDRELTIDFIFELLIKAIAALILMAIASVPFMIIRELGKHILDMVVYPFNSIFGFCWTAIVGVLYIVCCAFILIAMFKQYFKKNNDKQNLSKKTKQKEKTTKKQEENDENDTKHEEVKEKVVVQKDRSGLADVMVSLAKAFVIVMSLPLIFWIVGVGFGLAFFIYLICIGFDVYGFFLVTIGIFLISLSILNMVFMLIFKKKTHPIATFVIGLVILLIGGFFSFDYVLKFDVYDTVPQTYEAKTAVYEGTMLKEQYPLSILSGNVTVVADEAIAPDKIRIEMKYYDDFITVENLDISKEKRCYDDDEYEERQNCYSSFTWERFSKSRWDQYRIIRDEVKKNVKEHKIYDYRKLNEVETTVYVNPVNKDKILDY